MIVGMGFVGIRTARVLAGRGCEVVLVGRNKIGFRNRIVVMLNWIWYYWFHERQVRLITRRETRNGPRVSPGP